MNDTRSEAQKSRDEIHNMFVRAEQASFTLALYQTAEAKQALADWREKYPADADREDAEEAVLAAERQAEADAHQAEIRSRPGYQAALRGED